MDKEELQDKENQNLIDENSELSTDKQAPDETKKKEEDENLSSEDEIANLLNDLIKDHKEQSNLKKIESLEQKLINNLDENSYSELIKLKSQLNRD